jgi:putative transposase
MKAGHLPDRAEGLCRKFTAVDLRCLEIPCWDGQVVRVVFALDTCDREVMAWSASTGGISGEMVRDLMLEAVEKRFKASQTPRPI